jgi:hypothetical protein
MESGRAFIASTAALIIKAQKSREQRISGLKSAQEFK